MADVELVKLIDDLAALEGTSLLTRLSHAGPFVTIQDTADLRAVEQMVAEEEEHRYMLVQLLDDLNATPGCRQVIANDGELHYTKMETLIPHLIKDKQRLIAAYDKVAVEVSRSPEAADVVARITAGHRRHVEMLGGLKGAPTSG